MIKIMIKILLYSIRKYCYCKFVHKKYLCYHEVWGRGFKGPWHCSKCNPYGKEFYSLLGLVKERVR